MSAGSPDACFARVEAWIETRIERARRIEHAAHLIEHTQGRAPIAAVRDQVDASRWWFDHAFLDHIDMPAKRYARLIRLHHALPLLKSELDLAHVAVAAGSYDQAHFTNEVSAFCGHTPLRLRQLSSPHGYTAMIVADR